MERPQPPEHLHEVGFQIELANEFVDWLRATFIDEGAQHYHPVHEHLRRVDIVALWTNVEYEDALVPVAAAAEIIKVNGKPWARAERIDHLCLLHGRVPQARIWLHAPTLVAYDDGSFMATSEHELLHFAHKRNKEGEPMFDDEERPVLTKRGHDVGEFVHIMERYGTAACGGRTKEFITASRMGPLITGAQIAAACGTCLA
jgi:hypothetical protein